MSADVKPDDLKKLAPSLVSDIPEESITALISNAYLIALGDHFPKNVKIDSEDMPVRKMATEYMALHLISTEGKSGQGIVSEKVGSLERHYSASVNADWLNASPWGQAYLRLYKQYGGSSKSRYAVVQH